ncbi:MAG: leucine-rich repeat domain-containing protein [Bacilli bacterium]
MKRKLLPILPLLICSLFSVSGCDSDKEEVLGYTENLRYELSQDKTHYICTGFDGEMSIQYNYLNVPPTYNDLPVKQIGGSAFKGKYLTKVILPEGLESIQLSAFESCDKLVDITLPSSLVYIGQYAFRKCYTLEKIELPNTLETIDTGAFTNCAFDEIVIPASVTTMKPFHKTYKTP